MRLRLLALLAIVGGTVGILVSPFLSASWLATASGSEDAPLVPWVGGFRDAVGGALTFADADAVYLTYSRIALLGVLGILAGTIVLHARQRERGGRAERIGFWIAAVGEGVLALGLAVAAFTPYLDQAFLALMVPGMLAMIVGSVPFGIGTERAGIAPRGLGWLILVGGLAQIPLSVALGHNSLAFVPLEIAAIWAGAGALRAEAAATPSARA